LYGALPLIDEAHDIQNNSAVFPFLKGSYRRGSKYLKSKDNTECNITVMDNFGFKAFAGEAGFENNALSDRCIGINPEIEGKPEIQKFSYVDKELNSIRDDLLLFAKEDGLKPDLGNKYKTLTGRTRELYEPLIAIAQHIGISYDDIEAHATEDKQRKQEDRQTTVEYEILSFINETPGAKIMVEEIISHLGWPRGTNDERRKSGARFGYQFVKKCHIPTFGKGYYNRYIDLGDKVTYKKIKGYFIHMV